MRTLLTSLSLIAALLASPVIHAGMYKWVDSQGRVHFTDKPPPPAAKVKSEKLKPRGEQMAPETATPASQAGGLPALVLYSADCGPTCAQAKTLLEQRGVPFSYKDVQVDAAAAEAMTKLTGSNEVPVLTIGRNVHKGFQNTLWNNLLDAAGYGKPAEKPAEATP